MGQIKPTYKRQQFLLSFIQQIGENISFQNLQMLLFLDAIKHKTTYYDFVFYKQQPCSFQMQEDLHTLQRNGFLSIQQQHVRALGDSPEEKIFSILQERDEVLINKIYQEYLCHTEKKQNSQTEQTLFAIGYEGETLESFINHLIQHCRSI